MMNRQMMLSILNSMSDDKLVQAMGAAGIDMPMDQGYDLGNEEAEGIQSWNARDVSVPPANKPTFFDKAVIAPKPQMPGQRAYMQGMPQEMGGLDDYTMHQMHTMQEG